MSTQLIHYRGAMYRLAANITDRHFCTGYCTEFAIALHQVFGYSLKIVYDAQWDDYDEDYTSMVMVHCYGLIRSGVAVDAKGVRPEAQLLADVQQDNPTARLQAIPASVQDLDGLSMEGLIPEVVEAAVHYIEEHTEHYEE